MSDAGGGELTLEYDDEHGLVRYFDPSEGEVVRRAWIDDAVVPVFEASGATHGIVVVGPDGRIEAIFRRVKPDEHAEQVLATLGK